MISSVRCASRSSIWIWITCHSKNPAPKSRVKFLVLLCIMILPATCTSASTDRVMELYNRLQANPNDVQALNSYGIEQAQRGDLIGAIRTWRYALEISPGYFHLYNNIGSALRRLGHAPEALEWYKTALKIEPTYWTWYNIGLLYMNLNNYRSAKHAMQETLRLNPAFGAAKEQLAFITRTNSERNQFKPPVKVEQEPVQRRQTTGLTVENGKASVDQVKSKPAHSESVISHLPIPGESGGQVFLTFDGGAGDKGLDRILKTLAEHNVRSTFFLTGKWVRNYPDHARRILAEGHEIANHSMNHKDMSSWDKERIAEEIEATETAFLEILGRRGAPFFRFPFGHQNRRVEGHVEELGYRPVYWNIDTIDWREDPVQTIISRVRTRINRGSVILMHLGSNNGATALPAILREIISRGYCPDKLSNLNPAQLASLP